jgi:hypothetical protein
MLKKAVACHREQGIALIPARASCLLVNPRPRTNLPSRTVPLGPRGFEGPPVMAPAPLRGAATFDSGRGRRVEVSRVESLVLEAIPDPRFVDPENALADRSAALVP